jgi:hypothetical protein
MKIEKLVRVKVKASFMVSEFLTTDKKASAHIKRLNKFRLYHPNGNDGTFSIKIEPAGEIFI